jgi:flagellar biosynthesis/type III secretory pathway chaperone
MSEEKQPTCNCKDYGAELQELTKAVQSLVKLMSVLDRKVTAALDGKPTFEVL